MSTFNFLPIKTLMAALAGTAVLSTPPAPAPGIHLSVPFAVQAPDANWVQPWADACEEASLLMVDGFYKGKTEFSLEEKKQGISKILQSKNEQIGVSDDESAQTMMEMVKGLGFGWKAQIHNDPTPETIIDQLNLGRPVIVPIYARTLGNPHYISPGPDYHVVVIVGYDAERRVFKIHDPGTRSGQSMEFGYDVLMNSIHDLNPQVYTNGAKRVLFTEPDIQW